MPQLQTTCDLLLQLFELIDVVLCEFQDNNVLLTLLFTDNELGTFLLDALEAGNNFAAGASETEVRRIFSLLSNPLDVFDEVGKMVLHDFTDIHFRLALNQLLHSQIGLFQLVFQLQGVGLEVFALAGVDSECLHRLEELSKAITDLLFIWVFHLYLLDYFFHPDEVVDLKNLFF